MPTIKKNRLPTIDLEKKDKEKKKIVIQILTPKKKKRYLVTKVDCTCA